MKKTQDLKDKEMFKHYLPYAYFIDDEESIIFNKNDNSNNRKWKSNQCNFRNI